MLGFSLNSVVSSLCITPQNFASVTCHYFPDKQAFYKISSSLLFFAHDFGVVIVSNFFVSIFSTRLFAEAKSWLYSAATVAAAAPWPQPRADTTTAVASEAVEAGGSLKLSHYYDGDKRKRCHCRRDTDSLVIREIAVLCIKAFQKKLIK